GDKQPHRHRIGERFVGAGDMEDHGASALRNQTAVCHSRRIAVTTDSAVMTPSTASGTAECVPQRAGAAAHHNASSVTAFIRCGLAIGPQKSLGAPTLTPASRTYAVAIAASAAPRPKPRPPVAAIPTP